MSNLDLSIAKIMHGDTPVLKIMQGDTKVWPDGNIAIVDCAFTNVTSSIPLPARVNINDPFVVTLVPNTSCIINLVTITMGNNDITSTAYNDGIITIASITDDVVITASAIEVITFKDATVKEICVTNWGGDTIEGEITPEEARLVTSLNDAFYGNTTIKYFPELKYFTGLTGNWLQHPTTINAVSDYRGQFTGCTALEELEFPARNINQLSGSFFNCSSLKEVDLSPVTMTATGNAGRRFSVVFRGCSSLKKITLPQAWASSLTNFYQPFQGCSSLEYIDFGNVSFAGITSNITSTAANEGFNGCTSLTTIKNGFVNLKVNLRLAKSPLTRESVLGIIDNVYDYRGNGDSSTTKTITLKATTYALVTAEDIASATAKGWNIVSA